MTVTTVTHIKGVVITTLMQAPKIQAWSYLKIARKCSHKMLTNADIKTLLATGNMLVITPKSVRTFCVFACTLFGFLYAHLFKAKKRYSKAC